MATETYNENSSAGLWKLVAIVLGIVALGAIILAIMGFNKSPDNTRCANSSDTNSKNDTSGNNGNSGGSSPSASTQTITSNLKDFDINIAKLINEVGFSSATIMTLKTDAEGDYLLGEVKKDGETKFGYRPLPDGNWTVSSLDFDGKNDCKSVKKAELEAFENVKLSENRLVKCKADSGSAIEASEALKQNQYKNE